jgi:hypothetical protein
LQRLQSIRKNEEVETEEEETLKILVIFSKNRQRLTKKSCRRRELEEFIHFVKDFCRR